METAFNVLHTLQKRLGPNVDVALRAGDDELIFTFQRVEGWKLYTQHVTVPSMVFNVWNGNVDLAVITVKTQLAKYGGAWLTC